MSESTKNKLIEEMQRRSTPVLADSQVNQLINSVTKMNCKPSKDQIFEVNISDIKTNPYQYRTEESLDNSDLPNLAASISQHGLRTPIQLRRVNGELILIAGWRRYSAIKQFLPSQKTIKATIDDTLDDKSHRLLTILENEQREDFTIFEKARAYFDMRNIDNMKLEDIAKFVNSSKTRISQILQLVDLPETITYILKKGHLSGISNGHIEELVTGFHKRSKQGESLIHIQEWIEHTISDIVNNGMTISDIRKENSGLQKSLKKPLKKWKINGGRWNRFEVSTRNKVTLEFKLPDSIEHNSTIEIVDYIKSQLLESIPEINK